MNLRVILVSVVLACATGAGCPQAAVICSDVPPDGAALRDQAKQAPNQLVEIEDGPGDGVIMSRSNASNKTTVLLKSGQVRSVKVTVAAQTNFELRLLYGNDGPGTQDKVDIEVNGAKRSLTLLDTRGTCNVGDGWNRIYAAGPAAPVVTLNAGENIVKLTLSSADAFGAELDALLLFAIGN